MNSWTKRSRSSSTCPRTWKAPLEWSGLRVRLPPVRVMITAGCWSTLRSFLRSLRSFCRIVLLRRVRPLQAPRSPGVRRLAVMRASWRGSMPSWARPRPRRQRTRMIPWRVLPRRRSLRQKNSCPMRRGEPTSLPRECRVSLGRPRTWRPPRRRWRPVPTRIRPSRGG